MDKDYQHHRFDYRRSPDMDAAQPVRHPVVVVGAGPVGMATAIDLAQKGVRAVLLDDDNGLSVGSRAICFAKRTLEIFDRLQCGERVMQKGVSWNVGKVFFKDEPLYTFNLLPEQGHRRPAFINLQQYYLEGYLYERTEQLPGLEVRWCSRVTRLEQRTDGVLLTVSTPDGDYQLLADYVVAADGGRSPLRAMLGQESKGRVFRDRFLIADVKMKADFPTERWFWFDPSFHPGQSVLLHRQPDNVWRIDFQLGWDADPEFEKQPEQVLPRIKALLGKDTEFELDWVSVYTFSCLRMDSFRHGRVLFAGDSAHGVSPFGARGANSGVQDADNLAWKLKLVLAGQAPAALLDTYAGEREYAADENILNSTRATDFITPKSAISRLFRDAVLELAREHAFARKLVNSGRLSLPSVYDGSPLNTADGDVFAKAMRPGSPCTDAPVALNGVPDWFLAQVGDGFTALLFTAGPAGAEQQAAMQRLAQATIPVRTLLVAPAGKAGDGVLEDSQGLLAARYDAQPGTCYLLRPDQHVAARWREFDSERILRAVARATYNLHEVAA